MSNNLKQNVVTKYAFATRCGYQPGNLNKPNQDAFILVPNFKKTKYSHFFGVCDGHGSIGHEASDFVKRHLPKQLEICKTPSEAFHTTDKKMAQAMDISLSGTTVCCVHFEGTKVYTYNAGDSRAIVV